MPKFFQGSGPLGRDVAFTELSAAAQLSTPQILGSASSSTTITGNGTAQSVFSKSFTVADGEVLEIILHFRMNNTVGADTPDFVTKLGATTIDTSTLTTGASNAYRTFRIMYSTHATSGQGWGFVESVGPAGGTGTAAQNITKNDNDTWTNAITGLSLTCDSAIGTTTVVRYNYVIFRYKMGV